MGVTCLKLRRCPLKEGNENKRELKILIYCINPIYINLAKPKSGTSSFWLVLIIC